MNSRSAFDAYADSYDAALNSALAATGEDKAHFARERIAWLRRCLANRARPRTILDYGCGIGSATPYFIDLLGIEHVVGVDPSDRSIDIATTTWGSSRASFHLLTDDPPGLVDLAFCNGVWHHIPPERRLDAARYVHRSLPAGGLFALWENNPGNPGTRYVMRRCAFDRDAVKIWPGTARRVLTAAGFEILGTTFMFIFPAALGWLRGIEPSLSRLPIGGQYQVLARKI